MKNRWIAALLLGMAVTAGAQQKSAPGATIYVDVSDGRISVSTSAMKTPAGETTFTWRLRTLGYAFGADGVDFGKLSGAFNCGVVNDGQGIRCTKGDQAPAGEVPYALRVQGSEGTVKAADPGLLIFND